jgi:hypothetical protein
MPLLDHFHPPVSSRKEYPGTLATWASLITMRLNLEVLPAEFTAEPRTKSQFVCEYMEDPQVYAPPAPPLTEEVEIAESDTFEVLIYRDENRWRLAAAIELVSPANKDRPSHLRTFADKCLGYLSKGVSVVVVDVVTNRAAQTHAEIVSRGNLPASFAWQPASGLSVVSYRTIQPKAGVTRLDVWPTELHLRAALPTVPLWLAADLCVPLDLEPPYHLACQSLRLA